jgi:hypothetical protein
MQMTRVLDIKPKLFCQPNGFSRRSRFRLVCPAERRTNYQPLCDTSGFRIGGATVADELASEAGYQFAYVQAEDTRPSETIPRTFVTRFDGDRIFNALVRGASIAGRIGSDDGSTAQGFSDCSHL